VVAKSGLAKAKARAGKVEIMETSPATAILKISIHAKIIIPALKKANSHLVRADTVVVHIGTTSVQTTEMHAKPLSKVLSVHSTLLLL
jgi:glycine/D-amino acid oxidase-like deaminating enzyme